VRSRAAVAGLVIALLGVTAGLTLAATGDGSASRPTPSRAQLIRLQDRINRRWHALGRQGIYVMFTGQLAARCVSVELANPTRPNVAYLRQRFGPWVCVDRKPASPAIACPGYSAPPLPQGPAVVPNVNDLGLEEAERRVLTSGLTYTTGCHGDHRARVRRLRSYSPDQLARVGRQCPHAGQRVPAGTEVALAGVAILPGGYRYPTSAGLGSSCVDGRNAAAASRGG
jgi:hypothetical protein